MKVSIALAMLALLLLPPGAAEAARCSCTAPDDSCTASITCNACGCACSCPSNACTCDCICLSPALLWEDDSTTGSPEAVVTAKLDGVLDESVNCQQKNATELSALLADALDTSVVFTPDDAGAMFSFSGLSPRQMIAHLSRFGSVQIGGRGVRGLDRTVGRAMLDSPISLEMRDGNATVLARHLSRALGRNVVIQMHGGDDALDFEARDVAIANVLRHLSKSATIFVDGQRLDEPGGDRQQP